MLLKQLLASRQNSSRLLIFDPFRAIDRVALVKEVIGLANADVEGPRNILFGVNAGAIDGDGIVGISESATAELKKAHRLLSSLIQPVLHLAFIYDNINGKLVGALEIDGCDFGPYFVGQDFGESLSLGHCWIREGGKLQSVDRAALMNSPVPEPEQAPARLTEKPDIAVGFNDDPACVLLEFPVPDTSNPPFAEEKSDLTKTSRLKKAIKDTVSTVTTQMLRLTPSESDVEAQECEDAGKVFAEARNHYFFEEKAVKLNLCLCSKGNENIKDVSIELGFPRLPDFDVADRIHTSPFDKRSSHTVNGKGYPQVERRDDAIFVRNSIEQLVKDEPQQAFQQDLRIAAGAGMQRRKIAIRYKLRGPHGEDLGTGRLKIRFGRVAA